MRLERCYLINFKNTEKYNLSSYGKVPLVFNSEIIARETLPEWCSG